jgi:Secretion system C-terminal sorting domain
MQIKLKNIATIFLIGFLSFQAMFVFAEQPKTGSRLHIKPVVKTKTLHFTKGKSVLPFKSTEASFEIKPSKTVNLYFANLLLNKNLSKPYVKEQNVRQVLVAESSASSQITKTVAISSDEFIEPSQRLFSSESLTISNIFPNPADDAGYFEYSFTGGSFKDVKVDFFNVLGSPMNVSASLEKFDKKIKVNLKDFPNGFYFYQLIADGKTLATKKLLVRHYN